MTEENGSRWRWTPTTAALLVGALTSLVGVGLAWAAWDQGKSIGHDAAVTEAAVDRTILMDTKAKADALSERMGERISVDASHDARLAILERQHAETLQAIREYGDSMNRLVELMYKERHGVN